MKQLFDDDILPYLQKALEMKFNRFFLPDGKADPPEGVEVHHIAADRLLILMDGSKREYLSLNGKVQQVDLVPGDVIFFHREVWEEQNFSLPGQLLCIIPNHRRYFRLVLHDNMENLAKRNALQHHLANPRPVVLDVLRAAGDYKTLGQSHVFHLVRALLELTIQEYTQSRSKSWSYNNYVRCISYLQDNYHKHITRSSLAKYMNLTPTYISQLFEKHSEESMTRILQDIRLRHARIMLTNTDLSIKEIADACGFASDIYFIRCFRQKYLIPPRTYRLNYEKKPPQK